MAPEPVWRAPQQQEWNRTLSPAAPAASCMGAAHLGPELSQGLGRDCGTPFHWDEDFHNLAPSCSKLRCTASACLPQLKPSTAQQQEGARGQSRHECLSGSYQSDGHSVSPSCVCSLMGLDFSERSPRAHRPSVHILRSPQVGGEGRGTGAQPMGSPVSKAWLFGQALSGKGELLRC